MKNIFLVLAVLILCNFVSAQALTNLDQVKNIKIFDSSQQDVRKRLANFKHTYEPSEYQDVFYTADSEIQVNYSAGRCSEAGEAEGWNVPEWRVVYIEVFPRSPVEIGATGFNLAGYKREDKYTNTTKTKIIHNKNSGIAFELEDNKVKKISFVAPRKYYAYSCDKALTARMISTESWFDPLAKVRLFNDDNGLSNVKDLILDFAEVNAACTPPGSTTNKDCPENAAKIPVSTITGDPSDSVTYFYQVSGGKIIGSGAKVIWDLSGVKAGSYTIIASIDDGCGFCGKSMTKTMIVRD